MQEVTTEKSNSTEVPSKCLSTTETQGKAKLIKKIFSPAKADIKWKDASMSKTEAAELEDEIELQSFGDGNDGQELKKDILENGDLSKSDFSEKKKKKPWKCRFCNRRFLSKDLLQGHCKKRHPFKTLDGPIIRRGDDVEEEEEEVVRSGESVQV